MALTLKHLAAITVAGWGAVAVAYLPPSPDVHRSTGATSVSPDRRRAASREGMLGRQLEGLILLRRRDSLLATMARARHTPGAPFVGFDPQIARPRQERMATLVDSLWHAVLPVTGEFAVGVAFIVDTGQLVNGLPRPGRWTRMVQYVLPPATDGRSCLSIVSVPLVQNAGGQMDLDVGNVRPPLGPCGFYAAFGRPGTAVEEWLLDGGTALAMDAAFNLPPTPLDSSLRGGGRDWWWLPLAAMACRAGDQPRCREAVLARRVRNLPPIRGTAESSRWDRWVFGPAGDAFLADLVRVHGRERFAQFWTSPLPVDSAFAAAFGVPLGRWTARWVRNALGDPPRGTRTRPSAVIVSLLVLVALVAGGVTVAVRRTVA